MAQYVFFNLPSCRIVLYFVTRMFTLPFYRTSFSYKISLLLEPVASCLETKTILLISLIVEILFFVSLNISLVLEWEMWVFSCITTCLLKYLNVSVLKIQYLHLVLKQKYVFIVGFILFSSTFLCMCVCMRVRVCVVVFLLFVKIFVYLFDVFSTRRTHLVIDVNNINLTESYPIPKNVDMHQRKYVSLFDR